MDLFDHTEIGGEVKMYSLYSYQLADQAFGNGTRKLLCLLITYHLG